MYNIDLWLVAYEDTGIEKEIETYVLFSNITVYLSDAPSTLALKEKENIPYGSRNYLDQFNNWLKLKY